MRSPPSILRVAPFFLLVTLALTLAPRLPAIDSTAVKKLLADPPREYATAPLWVWNDMLTEQQIRDTMRDLAGQKVKQVFVHPRPGLMTPYLSPDWFRLWKVALDEAEKLDMNVWIYDENSYPSGFAGGHVPELMPESRGMGLSIKESIAAPKWNADTVSVLQLDGDKTVNVSDKVKAGDALPEDRYVVASIVRAANAGWTANRSYVNLLTPGVTEKFLEVTLDAYKREIGDQFGKRVPGVFTDEPNIRPAGGFPWCPDLPEQFQKRWSYSLLDNLASLTKETGDWRKVRHNYFSTINDLFIERWAKPFYTWCDTNKLEFTGHYWDHEWPHCIGVPDNMAMAAWQHRPGLDTLMNQYAENTHAQFGNVRFCREISSIANQLGRKRTLVELYGAGGWDLRFEDMKRIGDWLQVLGINTMDEHLSYITLRGARKRDHPQSFSYHEPWWEAYHVNAQYLARLSAVMSQGEQINRVLVIEPTTTAWMYQGNEDKLREIGDTFFKLLMSLETFQRDYDLGCEDTLARQGSVKGKELRVGRRDYAMVIIPPHTETINESTLRLLESFVRAGGEIRDCSGAIGRVNGGSLDLGLRLSGFPNYFKTEAKMASRWPWPVSGRFSLHPDHTDEGILFHHRRQLADGEILLIVNSSIESPAKATLNTDALGIEQWDLYSGETKPFPFSAGLAHVTLPPSGSLLLFLSKKPLTPAAPSLEIKSSLAASGPLEIRRLEPNVLTLDYVDISAGGETRTNQYFYAANQFAWQKNGMERNPWDSAVQFKDELITKKFPADSGFTASYRFTIEGAVPANLAIVIERPDLYTINCNGQPITAKPGDWWLDKAFGRIPIANAAHGGENVVTLKAAPFTMFHEIESAYVLGDFTLKPTQRGFVIAPDAPIAFKPPQPVLAHGINPDDTMWLSGGIGFTPGINDRAPFVVFDLGQAVDLTGVRVWNYAEAHVRDLTSRGTQKLRLSAGAKADALQPLGTEFALARAQGEARPETLSCATKGVRFVRCDILSNYSGVQFPVAGDASDNGFVGLAEVQFLDATGAPIRGVKIHQFSGELAAHKRTAARLVDGSGLTGARPGWNDQGHPFYSAGVAYRQRFNVAKIDGTYRVQLSDWYGSVARVNVNGQRAGYIVSPPWNFDVTKHLKPGDNEVEIVVIGTLKNTLGPHHGNHALGSAWPSMFQNGPKNGPPPGRQYSTVAYGLFAPFELRRATQ